MKNKVTGTMIYYYFVCKRKLYFFCNDIQLEEFNEDVAMGKFIDETSYQRENKHINIDGTINIDFMRNSNIIHEVKKSRSIEDASVWQVKYYIYYLAKRGVEIEEGIIDYPKLRERKQIILTDEDIEKIESIITDIQNIIEDDKIPPLKRLPICSKCAYYELCYI